MKWIICFCLALAVITPILADTPVRTTYSDPVTTFKTEESDGRYDVVVEITKTKDDVLVSTRICRKPETRVIYQAYYESLFLDQKDIDIEAARLLHRALGRALSRLDSLCVAEKGRK